MKYALILLVIAILWSIKLFVGYYILAWLIKHIMPWWYRLRGVRRDKQGQPNFAPVLKSLMLAGKGLQASRATEAAHLLYDTGGVRDTTTICAGVALCAGMAPDDVEREFDSETAAVVREAQARLNAPLPVLDNVAPAALPDRELAVRQVHLCAVTAALSRFAPEGDPEQRRLELENASKLVEVLRGTNEQLEGVLKERLSRAQAQS